MYDLVHSIQHYFLLVFQQIEMDDYMDFKIKRPVVRFYGITMVSPVHLYPSRPLILLLLLEW